MLIEKQRKKDPQNALVIYVLHNSLSMDCVLFSTDQKIKHLLGRLCHEKKYYFPLNFRIILISWVNTLSLLDEHTATESLESSSKLNFNLDISVK